MPATSPELRPTAVPPRQAAGLRAGPGLVVLLGHALLVLGLWQTVRPVRPGAAAQPRLPPVLWLRGLAAPLATTPAPATPMPRTRHPARPRHLANSPPPAQAAARPVPAPMSDADPQGLAISLPPAPPPAASQPPLDLRWRAAPAGRGHTPTAMDLLHGNRRRPTPDNRDTRLARSLGTDTTLREDRRGEVLRLQRGRDCVDVRPSRDAGLDPFGASAHTRPQLVAPC